MQTPCVETLLVLANIEANSEQRTFEVGKWPTKVGKRPIKSWHFDSLLAAFFVCVFSGTPAMVKKRHFHQACDPGDLAHHPKTGNSRKCWRWCWPGGGAGLSAGTGAGRRCN